MCSYEYSGVTHFLAQDNDTDDMETAMKEEVTEYGPLNNKQMRKENIEINSNHGTCNKLDSELIPIKRNYSCDQCDYVASRSDRLKAHKENKHQGIKYPYRASSIALCASSIA